MTNITYLSEVVFFEEVGTAGKVWVARGIHGNIYAEELDATGFSLPLWSSRERVEEFLKNARLVGPRYEPHDIPVDVFTNAWLSDKMKAIAELQINPDGRTTRVLVMSPEEFEAGQAGK
ncbi:MAG TPA: DUF2750 domain-containing protein [Geobacteraceae bacterium]